MHAPNRPLRLLSLTLLALACAAPGRAQGDERFVRATAGAKVYNFQDVNGKVVIELEEGALLRVHSTGLDVGFLEVSAAAGFPVWVYGEYLTTTGAEGVLRCTANGVRMRPLPDSSLVSYPLPSWLRRGDKVLFLERADPSIPMAEDWVRVQPAGARGWLPERSTVPVADLAVARAEWRRDVPVLEAPLPPSPRAVPGGAARAATPPGAADTGAGTATDPAIPPEAYRSLRFGNTLLTQALEQGKAAQEADFERAIYAYDVVVEIAPAGSLVVDEANRKRNQARAHQHLAAARAGLARGRVQDEERLRDLRAEREREENAHTVTWGRFMGRGWVESRKIRTERRWFLRWGGEEVYEITCLNGRYDLTLFEGYEIGVKGSTLRAARLATDELQAQVPLLDVYSIEVIEGSPGR